ncbi:putative phage-type endonuclease [Vibrio diazotrophicus]|uniref:Putative phage-type endonuclease n=1 Tax=Vibrio diazotrophicus TaxID=685 RepID=A0A329EA28_VIBDI|nr:YqaJ viral recombinase family protein [Vibrio diazotrophicus]RAS62656.1 putative phage-type endonuclease [Vibrio diazotrophicus]
MKVSNVKFHNVQQGTPEWHALRDSVDFTASEVSAALGCSPYKTRDQLMHEKATGIKPEVSSYQEKIFADGHRFEEFARAILENRLGEELYPTTITGECGGLTLLASLDGLTMDGVLAFEHKSPNSKVVAAIHAEKLDDHYNYQMEQQLLLSGAASCKFVASDGTEDNWNELDYKPNKALINKMLAGLKQFKDDLEEYKTKLANGEVSQQSKPEVVAEVIQDLPAISYKMNGLAINSNLDEYKSKALELVEQSKKKLETDQDFANAESMVKVFKSAEDKLGLMSQQVLGEVESIDKFVKDLGFIGENIRQARLALDKQVKSRKEEIKTELVMMAKGEIQGLIADACQKFNVTFNITADFAGAIKGKRNIESMRSAISEELANAKIALSEQKDIVQTNLDHVKQHQEYKFLFNDWSVIAFKPADDFQTLVKLRISEHKEAEEKRLEQERERIRQEEADKAKLEAEEKAKREANEKAMREAAIETNNVLHEATKAESKPVQEVVQQSTTQPSRLDQARQVMHQAETAPVASFERAERSDEMISLSEKEYNELMSKANLLEALYAAGVDNWDGYSEAMAMVSAA